MVTLVSGKAQLSFMGVGGKVSATNRLSCIALYTVHCTALCITYYTILCTAL